MDTDRKHAYSAAQLQLAREYLASNQRARDFLVTLDLYGLAECLHTALCQYNHTDGCAWKYEDLARWQQPTHREYRALADALMAEAGHVEDDAWLELVEAAQAKRWLLPDDLAAQMAVEYIVVELTCNLMVPASEARRRALANQAAKTQDYLRAEYDMTGALIALQELGYAVRKAAK